MAIHERHGQLIFSTTISALVVAVVLLAISLILCSMSQRYWKAEAAESSVSHQLLSDSSRILERKLKEAEAGEKHWFNTAMCDVLNRKKTEGLLDLANRELATHKTNIVELNSEITDLTKQLDNFRKENAAKNELLHEMKVIIDTLTPEEL